MLFWGSVKLRISSADINAFISVLAASGITIGEVCVLDELTVTLRVKWTDLKEIRRQGEKHCCQVEVVSRSGAVFSAKQILARPVLLCGLFVWLMLVIYIPTRILFVRVEGNERVPTLRIVEVAEQYGISFGSSRKDIRSERMKNALLTEITDLQWIGVNSRGCLAIISVKERPIKNEKQKEFSVGHIIASEDGVISDMIVRKGTPLCKTGDAVIKGQILVSGYTDCGLVLRAEEADAEVTAVTERHLTMRQPATSLVRKQIIGKDRDYSIQIGKNVVKLTNSAGISDSSCAKIYAKKYLTLPGGFCLPFALICEETIRYECSQEDNAANAGRQERLAEDYISGQIFSGRILSSAYQQLFMEGGNAVKGAFVCEEMIGRLRKEDIGK